MGKLSRIISYVSHYGIVATLALAYEKLFVDKRRFGEKKRRNNTRSSLDGLSANPQVESQIRTGEALTSFDGLSANPQAANQSKSGEAMTSFVGMQNKDKKLRILFALHYFYPERRGGTERFTLNLAKSALSSGDLPIVLVLDANLPKKAYTERVGNMLLREYEYDGIRCIGFRHIKAPRGLYYKNITEADADMRELCRYIIKREGIDIVHATYPQPFASFLAECRELGVPYAVTCTDFAVACPYATLVDKRGDICNSSECSQRCKRVCKSILCPDYDARREAAVSMLSGAFLRSVPSEFVRRRLSSETGLDFLVINHGISDDFRCFRARSEVRKILYAGTLSPLKGVHLLLDAFAATEGDYELVIAGAGDAAYEARLRKTADRRVRFVGAVPPEKMPKLYLESDLVVVPSLWHETYNFALREALLTGALVIASDLGAMPEALKVGECGFLFDIKSSESLKSALTKALAFDFGSYQAQAFPTVADEWQIYRSAYLNHLTRL